MCPDGLAWCVFHTGFAIIALIVICVALGFFDKD